MNSWGWYLTAVFSLSLCLFGCEEPNAEEADAQTESETVVEEESRQPGDDNEQPRLLLPSDELPTIETPERGDPTTFSESVEHTEQPSPPNPATETTPTADEPSVDDGSGIDVIVQLDNIRSLGTVEHTVDVRMTNNEPVAGFQFEFDGGRITASSGGLAAQHEFYVGTAARGIVGASLTLQSIEATQGLLTTVTFVPEADATELCLAFPIFSSPQGEPLAIAQGGCLPL